MPVFDYRFRVSRRQKQVIWVCGYQPWRLGGNR